MENFQNPKDKKEKTNNNYSEPNLKGYLFLLSGQLVSILGSEIAQFVIIWWIAIETGRPFYLGLAAFFGLGTMIILTPFAGVLVDRWNRKKIIGIVDFLQVLATLVLIYLFIEGIVEIWHIFIILALRGAFEAFHTTAFQAIIPLLVPQNKLSRINGLNYLTMGVIFLIGPLIAAVLYSFWDIHEILWIDAVTFLIAIIPLILITIPSVKRKQPEVEEKESFTTEFKEGISFIKEKKGLFPLIILFAAINFFGAPLFVLLPLLVIEIHGGMEVQFAILLALEQVGMISASLLMLVWKGFKRKTLAIVGGMFLGYLGIFIVAMAPKGIYWIMGFGMIMIGLAITIIDVNVLTIIQSIVPPELLGRVFSVIRTIAKIASPAAMILSGFLAEIFGVIPLIIATAVIGTALVLFMWFMTDLPLVDQIRSIHEYVLETVLEEQFKTIDSETLTS